jgi:transcriptional regulator with XRE-family HTH domain
MPTGETSFGATLRAWRDRLVPAAVGLPSGIARRAAGLRREELASLAGILVDYLARLEQGRAGNPSAQVVAALGRALQLDRQERNHLYRLAGLQPPQDGLIEDHIPPGLQRLLGRLGDTPAAVFTADWQLLWWNDGWSALFGDPSKLARKTAARSTRASRSLGTKGRASPGGRSSRPTPTGSTGRCSPTCAGPPAATRPTGGWDRSFNGPSTAMPRSPGSDPRGQSVPTARSTRRSGTPMPVTSP